MNIVAMYKTFSCYEFIEASIEAIYPYVSKIVMVDSNVNWLGEKGINEVVPVVKAWENKYDAERKIFHFQANIANQREQCNAGYQWIRSVLKPDWIMLPDTDEVFDKENMERLVYCIGHAVCFNSIHAAMSTFIKSPFYKVVPDEWCHPCVAVRPIHKNLSGTRGNQTGAAWLPADLRFCHYSYVRSNQEDVFKKIRVTERGDQDDVPENRTVDIDKWRKEKWDKLPNCEDFHSTSGYAASWHKIKVVGMGEVPETLRDKPIIQQYMGDCKNE